MKIVFVSSASVNSAGGDGRVARELANTLSQENPVFLILSGEKMGMHKLSKTFTRFEVSGKEKGDVILPTLNPVKISSLFQHLRNFNPDIIHFHDQGPVSFVVLLWALKNKIPTVFTSHTIPSEVVSFGLVELFPQIQILFDNKIFDSYFDLFLKKSSAIVAINGSVLKDLENYDLETPIYTIPNGRNLEKYNCVSFADIESRPINLIFVGYLNKRKNQTYLLDVMNKLPRDIYNLDLVGVSLNDSYDVELKNKAKKLDIPVNFLGKVSHKKIPSLLEKAHFFVSASLMEVQSLAVLEALASGTPIISLPNETTSEFVDETVGYNFEGLVEPATFAEKIESLASISTKEYKNMCIEAREKVADLDWCNIAVQTVEMYKELIERKEVSRKGLNGLKKLFDTIDISLFE